MTADGKARIISPDTEPQLFRATVGGVGQTGVITAATIRLAQCKSTSMRVKERRITGLSDFLAAFDSSQSPFHVGWIDALAKGKDLGRGVFEEADFEGVKPEEKVATAPVMEPMDDLLVTMNN